MRVVAITVPEQFVLQQVPATAAVGKQVFHLTQALTMHLKLAVAPVGVSADIPPGKTHFTQ
ncbi:hypothetical protein KKI96_22220, partial [Xenorhabdus bovienii]|nr:hypothetical protein [Xenorhabdus bovienii]